jgi:hypothetical protein
LYLLSTTCRRTGSGGVDPHILKLGTRRILISFTTGPLYPRGKNTSSHWMDAGSDPKAGLNAVMKIKNVPCWKSNHGCPTLRVVIIPPPTVHIKRYKLFCHCSLVWESCIHLASNKLRPQEPQISLSHIYLSIKELSSVTNLQTSSC